MCVYSIMLKNKHMYVYIFKYFFSIFFFFSLIKQMPASSLNYCYTGYHGADPELCVCYICVALFHPYSSKVDIIVFTL